MSRVLRAPTPPAPPSDACVSATPGGCKISDLFRVLGKSHMLDILWVIVRDAPRPRRFVEIQNELKLSPNTLAARLKDLHAHGLVSRIAHNEIPPRVDYAPTQKAHELGEVFSVLHDWARRNTLEPVAEAPDVRAQA